MAGADKVCGICGEWCDAVGTGEFIAEAGCIGDHNSFEVFKRFEIANVCKKCCEYKMLRSVSNLVFKRYTEKSHVSGRIYPWLYEVESEDICVYSKDKRKLRRALRKSGYSGNVRHLIK